MPPGMGVGTGKSKNVFVNLARAAILFVVAAVSIGSSSGTIEPPEVSPSVATVLSGPITAEGRYRVIVTVSEIYHHVFIEWLTYGPEGSGAKVASRYAVEDEKLGGWKYSVKMISNMKWEGDNLLSLRINDRSNCKISAARESYSVTCE